MKTRTHGFSVLDCVCTTSSLFIVAHICSLWITLNYCFIYIVVCLIFLYRFVTKKIVPIGSYPFDFNIKKTLSTTKIHKQIGKYTYIFA